MSKHSLDHPEKHILHYGCKKLEHRQRLILVFHSSRFVVAHPYTYGALLSRRWRSWLETCVCSPRPRDRLPPLVLPCYYVCSHICILQGLVLAHQNHVTPRVEAKGLKAGLERDTMGHKQNYKWCTSMPSHNAQTESPVMGEAHFDSKALA